MSNKKGFRLPSDTKKWVVFLAFILVLVLAYAFLLNPAGEKEVQEMISQAQSLYIKAEAAAKKTNTPQDLANVDLTREALKKAETLFVEGDFSEALVHGEKAKVHANKVLERAGSVREAIALIRLVDTAGPVTLRRKYSTEFATAKTGASLEIGDLLRTGQDGSSRIALTGGTEVVTEQITSFNFPDLNNRVTGAEAITDFFLAQGSIWVTTATNQADGKVSVITDSGKVTLFPSTEAQVSFQSDTGEVAVLVRFGRAEMRGESGVASVIKDQYLGMVPGRALGTARAVPTPPTLDSPSNFERFSTATGSKSVTLSWKGARASGGYLVEVCRNNLFNRLVYQRDGYSGTRVVVPDLVQGEYFWRVTSLKDDKLAGAPSEVRRFEVVNESDDGSSSHRDTTPPELTVTKVQVHGYIAIIEGKTEKNVDKVTVKDEIAVLDQESGQFTCAIRLPSKGVYTIDVVVTDLAGNRTTKQRTVEIRD